MKQKILVTGGNGSGCVLEPIISTRFREEFFDARPSNNLGGLTTSTGSGIAWEDAPASGPSKGLAIVLSMIF